MLKNNSLSVIIPTFNSSNFILNTLQSILDQIVLPTEVVIVDDGSSDNTVELVKSYFAKNKFINYKIFEQINKGPGAARNLGINNCTSEWVAFLDSDDIWYPNKLEIIFDMIILNPQINFFCNNELNIDLNSNKKIIDYSLNFDYTKNYTTQLYKKNYFSTSAVTCKKYLLDKFNGFDESFSSAQDYELWLRMSDNLNLLFIKEVLGEYRMRNDNISNKKYLKRYLNMIRIKIKHRYKVSLLVFLQSIFITTLEYIYIGLKIIIK